MIPGTRGGAWVAELGQKEIPTNKEKRGIASPPDSTTKKKKFYRIRGQKREKAKAYKKQRYVI